MENIFNNSSLKRKMLRLTNKNKIFNILSNTSYHMDVFVSKQEILSQFNNPEEIESLLIELCLTAEIYEINDKYYMINE